MHSLFSTWLQAEPAMMHPVASWDRIKPILFGLPKVPGATCPVTLSWAPIVQPHHLPHCPQTVTLSLSLRLLCPCCFFCLECSLTPPPLPLPWHLCKNLPSIQGPAHALLGRMNASLQICPVFSICPNTYLFLSFSPTPPLSFYTHTHSFSSSLPTSPSLPTIPPTLPPSFPFLSSPGNFKIFQILEARSFLHDSLNGKTKIYWNNQKLLTILIWLSC